MTSKDFIFPWRFIILSALLALLCSVSQSLALDNPKHLQKSMDKGFEYTIGLGDVLDVIVWKEPEITKKVAVRLDGRISLPLLGDINAVGKTLPKLAADLKVKLSELIAEPSVSVILVQNRSWRYYVIGQIKQPGEFSIDYPVTVLQAIAKSGGFLEWAKKDKILIVRKVAGQDKLLQFDYDDFVKGKNIKQNVVVMPEDVIVVP